MSEETKPSEARERLDLAILGVAQAAMRMGSERLTDADRAVLAAVWEHPAYRRVLEEVVRGMGEL